MWRKTCKLILGRHPMAWAIPSALFALVILETESCFLVEACVDIGLPILCFLQLLDLSLPHSLGWQLCLSCFGYFEIGSHFIPGMTWTSILQFILPPIAGMIGALPCPAIGWDGGLVNILPGLASNRNPLDLYFSSNLGWLQAWITAPVLSQTIPICSYQISFWNPILVR
jgi:hypothetical protein